jgi:hypothetical protein
MADDSPQDTIGLLGLLAYFELSDVGEIASASDVAQPVGWRLEVARHAGRALARCERVLAEIDRLGGSGAGAMEAFDGVFDDFDVRTVASTREEQVLRDYVGRTVAADFCRLVAVGVAADTRAVVDEVVSGGSVDEELVEAVAVAVAADTVLSARLALWGRRLVGEAFRLVQELLVQHASFARLAEVALAAAAGEAEPGEPGGAEARPAAEPRDDDAVTGWVLRRLTEQHAFRMRRLGLAA